MYLPVLYCISW